MHKSHTLAAAAAALFTISPAAAVSLSPDGLGQALIYPYYTAQPAEASAFNTYLSVVNHTTGVKAVRVRLREARLGREALSFNLFLAPNDVWTAAVVPTAAGARLVSGDLSCTQPEFSAADGSTFLDLIDPTGEGLDRTREGFAEMIEMGVLSGAAATFATHTAASVPTNCTALRSLAEVSATAPSGGLSGTLTLINVANGMDFTADAQALADLATRPFYRQASDPYPDFNAAEIDPVSWVGANGSLYRSVWTRGLDAVSAVLMRSRWRLEFVLDAGTRSRTDAVLAMPTRGLHATAGAVSAPFTTPSTGAAPCLSVGGAVPLGEVIGGYQINRASRSTDISACEVAPCFPVTSLQACNAANVFSVRPRSSGPPPDATTLLGSTARGYGRGVVETAGSAFPNGWIDLFPAGQNALVSLPSSTRIDPATGATVTGAHSYTGLPVIGLAFRSFENGALSCGSLTCQGNYGGAFAMKYMRSVSPAPQP